MSDKISLIIEATDNASSVLGGIGQSIGNLGRIAGGLALGGVAAMGAGLLKLGSDGLSLNNSMEKVTAQLNAFTKDGAKTADIIETVRERAAKTPFEFDAMAKAAVALFPASKTAQGGLEGILEKAEILAASNPAEGLEGAAFALKEAVSGDFTSIIERFNLPRQYINDLKKEGVPNLEIVQRAMKEMGLDVDLVSNLANTAEGRWSTFKDTLAGVAAQATKPIFDAMSGGIAQVNTYLEANGPLLNEIGATIAGTLTTAIQGLTTYLPMVIAGFQQFGATITPLIMGTAAAFQFFSTALQQSFSGDHMDAANVLLYALEDMGIQVPEILKTIVFAIEDGFYKIPEIISGVGASFNLIGTQIAISMLSIQPALDGILQAVTSVFGSLIPIALTSGMGAWTLISTTIQTAISSAISIVQTWLPMVQTALGGIATFLTMHGAEIQLLISTAWNAITTIIQTAITTVTTIINALAPVVNEIFGAISTFLNAHGSEILWFLTSAWDSISAIVSGVAAIIQKVVTDVFGAVASFIKNHGDQIQTVLTGAWNFIKTTVGGALDIIKGLVSAALAIVNGDWDTAWKSLESVTKASNDIIKSLIDTAMTLIEGVIRLAVDNFKRGWEMGWRLMQTATDTAMTLIKDAINNGIEKAKTVIADGVEAFLGKFRDLRDKMSVIGQQLLEGMVQGIRDKVGWLVDEAVRASNAVLAAIKNTLGIKSPSKEGELITYYTIAGLANEWSASGGLWIDAAVDTAERMVEHVKSTVAPLPEIMSAAITPMAQVVGAGMGNMSLNARWFAEDFEDQILFAAEMFVELAQTGDHSSLLFAQSFEAIRQKINELVPSFDGGQAAMQAMHAAMVSGKFDVEAYWAAYADLVNQVKTSLGITQQNVQTATQNIATVATGNASTTRDNVNGAFENILVVAGVAINTLTGEVLNSSSSMTTAMSGLANAVTSATQTMQTQASSAAQSIASSMIAAGQVINTTQQQLAGFIQSGGVGGITGGTYTPSAAFQALFTNPPPAPVIALPRPSSIPKGDVVNNTPISITINSNAAVDRYEVESGTMSALRRAGLTGRFA